MKCSKLSISTILIFFLIANAGFLFSAEKHLLTPEIMLSLKKVAEPRISPDGKWILYSLTTPVIQDNKNIKDIMVISLDGKKKYKITTDKIQGSNAIWSPDGKKIAFLSSVSGKSQIFLLNFETFLAKQPKDGQKPAKKGKEISPVQISDLPHSLSNLQWSPDGKKFLYTAEVKVSGPLTDKYADLPSAKVRLFDSVPIRHWDEWNTDNYSHVFIAEIPDKGKITSSKDIMENEKYDSPVKPFGGIGDICWSPDSKEIAYTSKKVERYAFTTNNDIYIYYLDSNKTTNITKENKGADGFPVYSPDGKWIAYHSQKHEGFESDRVRLMLYNRKTTEIKELSYNLDQWVGDMVWAPDCKKIWFTAEEKATVQLYDITVPDGKWNIRTLGMQNIDGGIEITSDGKTIVAGKRSMLRPTEIFSIELKENFLQLKPITDVNGKDYENLKLADIRERYINSVDSQLIHTYIVYPPDFTYGKKYPVIVYCQGGPQSTVSQFFSYRWNFLLMASQGYIVIAPNRRGLPGFGQKWNDAISEDWGGKPMQDILSVTDSLSKEHYIDKDRIAAVGASAGGYAVFWLAGNHHKRFSAFVSHCGVFNLVSMYGSTEELWFPNWENGGPYWIPKWKDKYDVHSPHVYSAYWDTPIMISTGEYDFRVPYTQSLEAYTVAQSLRIPSRLIIFPEENHWILGLQNALVWQKEYFEFLDKYCKNKVIVVDKVPYYMKMYYPFNYDFRDRKYW
ncbi:MAG: S9 family peptidase [Bacteroidota bacterium]